MAEPMTADQTLCLAAHKNDARAQHPSFTSLADARIRLSAQLEKLQATDVPLPTDEAKAMQGRRLLQVATIALIAVEELQLPWTMPETPPSPLNSDCAN